MHRGFIMEVNFLRNPHLDRVIDTLMPVFAVILALLIGAVMLVLLGADPIEAYRDGLYEGALGSKNAVADTLIKATPLLLVGIGICISFRGGVINIGGEGQMITPPRKLMQIPIPTNRSGVAL